MGGEREIKEDKAKTTNPIAENIFDQLKKIPENKDKTAIIDNIQKQKEELLTNPKNTDIKNNISQTIDDLLKEKIISLEDLEKNLKTVFETILSDPLYEIDVNQKEIDSKNIFLFRTSFQKKTDEETKAKEEENKIKAEDTKIIAEDTKIKAEDSKIVAEKEKTAEEILNQKLREGLATKYAEMDIGRKIDTTSPEFLALKAKDPNVDKFPPDKQNLYVSYLFAGQKIVEDAKKQTTEKKFISQADYDFIIQFNELNTNLGVISPIKLDGIEVGIPSIEKKIVAEKPKEETTTEHTIADIVSNENLWAELVENNTDIENFVLDTKTDTVNTKEIEDNKDVNDIIQEKVGTWYEADIASSVQILLKKNKLEQYTANFDKDGKVIDSKDIPEKDKEKLEKISTKVIDTYTTKAQEKILEDTNKVIKTKAIAALIQNVGQYFHIDDLAEDFTVDLESGVTFNEKELKLTGTMEGKEMSFYYDMNLGKVAIDTPARYDETSKTFAAGREELSWLKMPTFATALETSKTEITAEMSDTLEKTDDLRDTEHSYEDQLNKTPVTIDQKSDIADIVIEHAMAKNMAVQDMQDILETYMPTRDTYAYDKEQQEYNLYKIIDTSMNRYTTQEITTRRASLKTFATKIQDKKAGFNDDMLKDMFSEETARKDAEGNYTTAEWPNMYKFIKGITYNQPGTIKNDVIDLSFFGSIVTELQNENGTTKNLKGKSDNYDKLLTGYTETKEKDSADNIIDWAAWLRTTS